jgi:hypothetical protein
VIEKCAGTIKFDNDAAFRTIEIDNVATYAVLSTEFLAKKLAALKVLPEDGLGCSQRLTQVLSESFL